MPKWLYAVYEKNKEVAIQSKGTGTTGRSTTTCESNTCR